ncbi:MAG: DsbA family protein [Pseudomonadota bacterium]
MNIKTNLGIGAALVGAFILGAVALNYSSAQQGEDNAESAKSTAAVAPVSTGGTSFSDQQENEIRFLVKQYLLQNPEVIIEAVNEYSRRQQALSEAAVRDAAAANIDALLDSTGGYVAGKNPDNAKVAVIELFDYHCGYCKRAAPLVKSLTKKEDDVKIVFREYPILRDESDYAAEVALAARDQGKFLDMHFAMMEANGVLTKDRIEKIAKKNGVNLAKLEASLEKPAISASIRETVSLARSMGVSGTPAFIIASVDGNYVNVVEGFRPDEVLNAIDEARAAAN